MVIEHSVTHEVLEDARRLCARKGYKKESVLTYRINNK